MKYYIIAGEASGDLHASNLIKALKAQDSEAEFRAWGGDLMEAQGAKLVKICVPFFAIFVFASKIC